MARTMSVGMAALLAESSRRLVQMLRLERRDGTVICLTSHDQELIFNLGMDGDETYKAGSGIITSDIAQKTGLDVDTCEVNGPMSADITLAGILGGRFNGANAWLFEVCWDDLALGYIPWLGGQVIDARPQGSRFVLELGNAFYRLSQTVGKVIQLSCRAIHGDAQCNRVPEETVGTVTVATDGMGFEVTPADAFVDGYYDKGWVIGLTGENAGVELEIERSFADGEIRLFGFLPVIPEVGDTFTLKRGCGNTRADCMERDNILNFRGEPDCPGTDQVIQPAIPGQGNG